MEQAERAYSEATPFNGDRRGCLSDLPLQGVRCLSLDLPIRCAREWHERRPDRSYSASVLICQAGELPNTEHSRIFALQADHWESIGTAKRAATKMAEAIIDGFVLGQSMISD